MEKLKMDDILSVEKTPAGRFKISWKMTDWCNYRCEYCYMDNAVKRAQITDEKTVLDIAGHIDRILEQARRTTSLHLIGGEVCYFNLEKVLARIRSQYLKNVIIATNFSAPLAYWQSLARFCAVHDIKLVIMASMHLTQCGLDEFIGKAAAMKSCCVAKCVVNSANIGTYKPIFARLKDEGVRIQITVQRDTMNACENLSEADYEYVRGISKEFAETVQPYCVVTLKDGTKKSYGSNISFINDIDIGGFDSDGFYCTCGVDGIRIRPDGNLQRAGCKFAFLNGQLGHISQFSALPEKGLVCSTRYTAADGTEQKKYCTFFSGTSCYRDAP